MTAPGEYMCLRQSVVELLSQLRDSCFTKVGFNSLFSLLEVANVACKGGVNRGSKKQRGWKLSRYVLRSCGKQYTVSIQSVMTVDSWRLSFDGPTVDRSHGHDRGQLAGDRHLTAQRLTVHTSGYGDGALDWQNGIKQCR